MKIRGPFTGVRAWMEEAEVRMGEAPSPWIFRASFALDFSTPNHIFDSGGLFSEKCLEPA